MRNFYSFLLLVFFSTLSYTQVTNSGQPVSWGLNLDNQVEKITLPDFDLDAVKAEDAINDYTLVINNSSREWQVNQAYYQRGLTKERMGDTSGAIADLNETSKRNSYDTLALIALGRLNFKAKNYLETVSNYDKVIEVCDTERFEYWSICTYKF